MSRTHRLGHAVRLARLEGLAGFRDRLLDRCGEARRRLACALPGRPRPRVRVLHLLAAPPVPWLGGVQVQLLERRRAAGGAEPFALLFRHGRSWSLRVEGAGRCSQRRLAPADGDGRSGGEEPELLAAVAEAVELLAPAVVHVENPAGFALADLVELSSGPLPLVLSVHDFSLFCIRPHLLEHPSLTFCRYSREPDRCSRCLAVGSATTTDQLERHRRLAAVLLERAAAVVFPSPFLRDRHRDLFPGVRLERAHVVPPSSPRPRSRPPRAHRRPRAGGGPWRIAVVGGAAVHKGSRVLDAILAAMTPEESRHWRIILFGGGDISELARLRRHRHLRVRGYYRAGLLPRLLSRRRCELALLLSVVPESYGLALDECRQAGVPVVAFDHGAVADRLRASGGGWLVPPEEGARGVLATLRGVSRGEVPPPPAPVEAESPGVDYDGIYREAIRAAAES